MNKRDTGDDSALDTLFNNEIQKIDINSEEYFNAYIDLQGLCAVSLVELDGVVLEGKPELGVYKYKNHTLIFDSVENIIKF